MPMSVSPPEEEVEFDHVTGTPSRLANLQRLRAAVTNLQPESDMTAVLAEIDLQIEEERTRVRSKAPSDCG
jgi:hypothetical protein